MYWIYILKCEDDVYYVGQTSRLYRRFWEHQDGRGGLNKTGHTDYRAGGLFINGKKR